MISDMGAMVADNDAGPHGMAKLLTYSGPTARRDLAFLASALAYQRKEDGAFCRVTTDAEGKISYLTSRSGAPLASTLLGLATGLPDAEIHGELESHTEAGIRAAASRGWQALHLFDLATWRSCDVRSEPYATRYSLLHRWQAAAEFGDIPRRDWWSTDRNGDHHDAAGRYVRPVPADLRRLPILPLYRGPGAGERCWADVMAVGGEGVVAIDVTAPMGVRGAKFKIRNTHTLDATVLRVDRTGAIVTWGGQIFAAQRRKSAGEIRPGDLVECEGDGWYDRGAIPKFARIVRVRTDLKARTA